MRKFEEAKEYLDSFINYEKRNDYHYRRSFKLKRVRQLMNMLGVPYKRLKAIHISGTKGKGSTATFVSYILAASGFKAGLYTSPHFADFRERIKIIHPIRDRLSQGSRNRRLWRLVSNGVNHGTKGIKEDIIPKEDVVRIINEFKLYLDKVRSGIPGGKVTFFEVYTAIAFRFFIERGVDYAILEVGLGGRLDATNIVRPMLSIITHIGYDHTKILGNKLSDIAREKAGIIKRRIPLVVANQRKSALSVILKKARMMNAENFVLGRDFYFYNVRLAKKTTFDFCFKDFKLHAEIPLKGRCQVENASLAIAAMRTLEKRYIGKRIEYKKGLKSAFLEGRFEIASRRPLIILDIAHNVSSFYALSKNIKDYFPQKRVILIFAASKDKNVKKMISVINYNSIIITSFNNPRAMDCYKIEEFCRKKAVIEPSIEKALKRALSYYNKDCLILVSGSFFLVSEAKKALKRLRYVNKGL